MKILIVENVMPKAKGGNDERWMEEAERAYGLAARDEFDVILGLDEDGECHIIKDETGEVVEAESVMT